MPKSVENTWFPSSWLCRFPCWKPKLFRTSVWLVDINPRHQPVELLPCEAAYLGLISGPTVVSLGGQPFVDQYNTVRLFHYCFDPVTPAATEQEKSMADIHGELLLYDCTEPIDRLAHVGPSTDNVDCVYSRDVG